MRRVIGIGMIMLASLSSIRADEHPLKLVSEKVSDSSPAAENPVTLQVRAVGLNRARVRKLGFGLSVPTFDSRPGKGLSGFIDALKRENVLSYDSTIELPLPASRMIANELLLSVSQASVQATYQRLGLFIYYTPSSDDRMDLHIIGAAHDLGDLEGQVSFKEKVDIQARDCRADETFVISLPVQEKAAGHAAEEQTVLLFITPKWTGKVETKVSTGSVPVVPVSTRAMSLESFSAGPASLGTKLPASPQGVVYFDPIAIRR